MDRQQVSKTDSLAKEVFHPDRPGASKRASLHPLHQLRGALGNRAFGRFIQTKLKVSQPGDEYEQEADRVADEVMRMPAAPSNHNSMMVSEQPGLLRIQRLCGECQAERHGLLSGNQKKETDTLSDPFSAQYVGETGIKSGPPVAGFDPVLLPAEKCPGCTEVNEEVQLKEIPGASPTAHPLGGHVSSMGKPLDASVRSFFEPRFGYSFSGVRIHTDGHAAKSAQALNAHAYTLGKDIVFNEDSYSPETYAGRRLLAHELVHVVQQGQGASADAGSQPARVEKTADWAIARQAAPPSPADPEQKTEGPAPQLPPEIIAAVNAMLERSESEADDDSTLSRIGQMAVRLLGPTGVVAVAQQAGVPGADRREQEAQSETGPTVQRQAAQAAAATAGTMWWLTLVDGPLPIGDIVYGALIIGAAIAASRAIRTCRCTIRYAPPEIMAQCPERVYGTGVTIGDCQNVAKFTAPQQCRRYYGHCGFMP